MSLFTRKKTEQQERKFKFKPKPDITTFELAQVVAAMRAGFSKGYNDFPVEVQRHFEEIEK